MPLDLGGRAQGGLDLSGAEPRQSVELFRQARERLTERCGQVLLASGLVDVHRVDQKRTELVDELIEVLDPRLQQIDDPRDPSPSSVSSAARHRSASRSRPLIRLEQVERGKTGDVLLVEPVQFFGVEDGVAAADAIEREQRDQLVPREAPRDRRRATSRATPEN